MAQLESYRRQYAIESPSSITQEFNDTSHLLCNASELVAEWEMAMHNLGDGYAVVTDDTLNLSDFTFEILSDKTDAVSFFLEQGEYTLELTRDGKTYKRKFVIHKIGKGEKINGAVSNMVRHNVTVIFTTPFFIQLVVFGLRADSSWTSNELYSGGF